ncbi:MAG: hypothetical protein HW387_256 [Parachlamydiales bacterium]|nr:hypothetical protein [Parachlamydiales bacterium]
MGIQAVSPSTPDRTTPKDGISSNSSQYIAPPALADSIAQAPSLDDRPVNDPHEQTDRELDIFIHKASMLAMVIAMDHQIAACDAMDIVNSSFDTHRSIYSLFMEKTGKNRSFFQKRAAGFKYFFLFRLGIIPNTLDTFMKTLLAKMRSELIHGEGGLNIPALNHRLLSDASFMLDLFFESAENYANGKDKARSKRELLKQGTPFEQICRQFAQNAVYEFLPRVPFFISLKKSSWFFIRWSGFFFDATIGYAANRFLRFSIGKCISFLFHAKSTGAPSPSLHFTMLPFAVAITSALIRQLQKFKTHIESTIHLPNADDSREEKLLEVVTKLIKAHQLASCKTHQEVQNQLKPASNTLSQLICVSIDQIDISRIFLTFISDPEHSEEIFYSALHIFDVEPPSTPEELKDLLEQYEALKGQIIGEGRELFSGMVIEQLFGPSEKRVQQMALSVEQDLRTQLTVIHQPIQESDRLIQGKLEQIVHLPSEAIHELNDSVQRMQRPIPAPLDSWAQAIAACQDRLNLGWHDVQKILILIPTVEASLPERGQLREIFDSMRLTLIRSIQIPPNSLDLTRELNAMIQALKGELTCDPQRVPSPLQPGIDQSMQPIHHEMGNLGVMIRRTQSGQASIVSLEDQYKDFEQLSMMLSQFRSCDIAGFRRVLGRVSGCYRESPMGRLLQTFARSEPDAAPISDEFIAQLTESIPPVRQQLELSMRSHQLVVLTDLSRMPLQIQKVSENARLLRIRKIEPMTQIIIQSLGGAPATICILAGIVFAWQLSYIFGHAAATITGTATVILLSNRVDYPTTVAVGALSASFFSFHIISTVASLFLGAMSGKLVADRAKNRIAANFHNYDIFDVMKSIGNWKRKLYL